MVCHPQIHKHCICLQDVDRLRTLQAAATSEEKTVPVQAYLTSGADLCHYVVTGVDMGESPGELVKCLTCALHQAVSARYKGKGRTCLVTPGVPPTPPEHIIYYGCLLQFRPYQPSVIHCYSCFHTGHMRSSCLYGVDSNTAAGDAPAYKCGLCKSNDHELTDKACPTKPRKLSARHTAKTPRQQTQALLMQCSQPIALHYLKTKRTSMALKQKLFLRLLVTRHTARQ